MESTEERTCFLPYSLQTDANLKLRTVWHETFGMISFVQIQSQLIKVAYKILWNSVWYSQDLL